MRRRASTPLPWRTSDARRPIVKAIEISAPGPADVLRPVERPDPKPGAGEALIRVAASGINRPDVLQRKGLYPVPPGASDIPGLEVAGTIVDGDRDALAAAGLAVGARVCALVAGGGYAELCVAPVGQCLPSPAKLSDVEAASLPETFFTVWSNVFDRAHLRRGETLLVHGGSSGIGVTAIQLAKAWGARVITTVGSAEKAAACRALGADHAIDYKTQDFVAEVLRLTGGAGADVVLDMVAGDYIARNVQCLAEDGRIVIIAVQGGESDRRRRPRAAPAPHHHRLDAASATGRVQGADRRCAEADRMALARVRRGQAGDPRGFPGRRGGARPRADGIEPAHRQAGADVVVAGGAAPRTKLVVGNWKMNGSVAANAALLDALKSAPPARRGGGLRSGAVPARRRQPARRQRDRVGRPGLLEPRRGRIHRRDLGGDARRVRLPPRHRRPFGAARAARRDRRRRRAEGRGRAGARPRADRLRRRDARRARSGRDRCSGRAPAGRGDRHARPAHRRDASSPTSRSGRSAPARPRRRPKRRRCMRFLRTRLADAASREPTACASSTAAASRPTTRPSCSPSPTSTAASSAAHR